MISELKDGGVFLLNCAYGANELDEKLPADVKRQIASRKIRFYTIDANRISRSLGLGNHSNTVLQAAFFSLADIIPVDEALGYMKAAAKKAYSKKGEEIVRMNVSAIDEGARGAVCVDVRRDGKTARPRRMKRSTRRIS
jgi:pyruvate-ferredoxin/flavodoxin oxidoreductase